MRYSKSSLLSIALTVGVSAVTFTASAQAQNRTSEFPWRANAKTQAKSLVKSQTKAAVQKTDSFVSNVETAFSTPARDLRTVEKITTPTPGYESMPSVIYDEGKKYIRQGDTYIESTNVANVVNTGRSAANNFTQQVPAVNKKTSLFQKTKGLTSRLNPFSTKRASTAYNSSDWKVPSFSKTLPVFSSKDNDPITFAAVAPLPAKTSTPSSIDATKPLYATNDSKPSQTFNTSPTLSLPARDSQFSSALPTETKLTSIFDSSGQNKSSSSGFEPSKFEPVKSTSKRLARMGINTDSGTGNLVSEVESGFSSANNFPQANVPHISVFENKNIFQAQPASSAPAARTASLSADGEFWSPRR